MIVTDIESQDYGGGGGGDGDVYLLLYSDDGRFGVDGGGLWRGKEIGDEQGIVTRPAAVTR